MIISKDKLLIAGQACINSYKSSHGEVDDTLFDNVDWFYERSAPKYFMGWREKDNTLWVVFKGTSSSKGWENNADHRQRRVDKQDKSKGFYHNGFYKKEVQVVFPEIISYIFDLYQKRNKEPFNIIITGHSKGGSNALLFAYNLKFAEDTSIFKKIECIALAPARVTSPLAAKQYKKLKIPTMIFQYGNDTVCRVPFRIMPGLIERSIKFFKWRWWFTIQLWSHPAKVTHIGETWYIALMHWIPFVRFFGNPFDHYPERYMKGIKMLKE